MEKKTLSTTGHSGKRPYTPPSMGVHTVEMEQGIAAGSVIPTDPSGEIMEEWETGEDREGEILW